MSIKLLPVLLLILLLLSSCYGYKNLTKTESVTLDFLAKLEPGRYKFKLTSGLVQYVELTTVDADSVDGILIQKDIYGNLERIRYSGNFETIQKNVRKISHYEFSKQKTFGVIFAASIYGLIGTILMFGSME